MELSLFLYFLLSHDRMHLQVFLFFGEGFAAGSKFPGVSRMDSLSQICLFAWTKVTQGRGKTSYTEAAEQQTQRRALALGQHPTHCTSGGVSRTRALLRHVKGELTPGGLAACFVTTAKPAFIPLQRQFAVCDLWKGNGTWQELLASQKHLRATPAVYPLVIFFSKIFFLVASSFPPVSFYLCHHVFLTRKGREEARCSCSGKIICWNSSTRGHIWRELIILLICKRIQQLTEGADMWDKHNYLWNSYKLRDFMEVMKGKLWEGLWRGKVLCFNALFMHLIDQEIQNPADWDIWK